MAAPAQKDLRISRIERDFHVAFQAMATPCEVRIEMDDATMARAIAIAAEAEARRIEHKFSRYRSDSVIGKINASGGAQMVVDGETASLLDCAAQCYETSGGLFDITSGVLRRAWRFDGSDNVPAPERVQMLMSLVGWHRVTWAAPAMTLPPGMELDLGGIAKEYAVDKVLAVVTAMTDAPALVNFGGDLCVSGPRRGGAGWNVAIESVDGDGKMAGMLQLTQGALATSGDARRFLMRDGRRYGHILDPRTGWPVDGAPRSITVAAASCVEAGIMATLAMLQGAGAEAFLAEEEIRAWCIR